MPVRVGHSRTAIRLLGRSAEGRPVQLYEFGSGSWTRLILAGVHGDEPKSVDLARRLCDLLDGEGGPTPGCTLLVVPVVNPDGYARRRRRNARRVDLNRNFPTADWSPGARRSRFYGGPTAASEPETAIVVELIRSHRPDQIITIHSISDFRFCNNYDGPGERLARQMARYNDYPVRPTMGYATPGSFGTWAGAELGIPTVTLELPSHHGPRRTWETNREALLVGLESGEQCEKARIAGDAY